MKRLMATLMVVAMLISTMVVGTVPAAAAEVDDAASKYVTLDGEWHFKNYRTYSNMYQYIPYAAMGYFKITWEDLDAAAFPDKSTWESWDTIQMPYDNPELGGVLSHDLAPKWSESWVVREFDLPEDFTEEENVILLMGIIDDNDVVYINGEAVAASGFVDGNGKALIDVPAIGGFDYTAADKADQVKWQSSYWQIKREYKIPTDVLNLGGTNEIAIRLYNNNDYGGFYAGNNYAICGNELAARNVKGLPTQIVESEEVMAAVEAQIAAMEAGDVDAFAATISDNYHNDANTKADRVAEVAAEIEAVGDHTIDVVDANGVVYKDEDGNFWYSAHRTFHIGEAYSESRDIELCYKVSGGKAQEIGNWNRCYGTSYSSELFGQDLTYSVYLPPSYYTDSDKQYPVVWLLHGMNSSSSSFLNVDKIGAFMDNLINSDEIVEMVVVMPDSGKTAFYSDSELDPNNKDGTGPWATQLNVELRGVVQDIYRVYESAGFNGVTGISMGGGGAMTNGSRNPDLYSSIGVHMGAVSGSLNDLKALTAEQLAKYDIYIDCGLDDTRVYPEPTIAVHEYLESVGKEHGYDLRPGGHNSAFYMEGMDDSMKMHSDHFVKNGLEAEDEDKYVALDGEWHFKNYRTYANMFQYHQWNSVTWEDLDAAVFPSEETWKSWDTIQMPYDNPELGGVLSHDLAPKWSESWVVREFDLPENFTDEENVILLMGIIDDNDVVYINGVPVAASGFVDGNGNALEDVPAIGGFDYKAADKADQVQWKVSYWQVKREYQVPADVLNLGGTNEIAIRLYNNNDYGGFYAGNNYAICGNELAARNVKGLPTQIVESDEVMAAVEAQVAAIEAGDVDAFAATISDNYHNDANTKADRVAEVAAEIEAVGDYTIDVVDANGVVYKDEDGNFWYSAHRTFHIGEAYSESRDIELCYKVSGGQALEIGNWNRCYGTSYASELFGKDLTYSVYLPPSYYINTTKQYPVVWLLHGMNSSSSSFLNVDKIGTFMDELIASGEVVEMVVVMPDSGKTAFYANSELDPSNMDGTGPWADQLNIELRGVVQDIYRVRTEATFNGVTGISMGGGGAMTNASRNPDLYSSIGVHMGAVSGSLNDLKALSAEQLARFDIYIDCGLDDTRVGTEPTIAVHEYLESVGKEHGYDLRPGGHNSAFYMEGMDDSMKMHSDHFNAYGLFPSSGGGSSSNTTSTTTKNEDGSTTTVTTNKKTGEVTETNKTTDGVTGTVVTDKDGAVTEISAKIPSSAAQNAAKDDESIIVPIEIEAAPADEAIEVKVDIPSSADSVVVEIPVSNVEPGTVVVVVKADGTEEILKTSGISENGVIAALEEDVTIKIVDAAQDFGDVKSGDWFSDAADFASARGLMNGVGNGSFAPAVNTTRSMIAQILYSMENNPDVKNAGSFTDVEDGHWYADAAAWAAEKGIVSGYPDGSFGGDDSVTREQLAVMLWRYAGSEESDHDISSFKDNAKVSDYAAAAIRWAVENSLLSGKGNGNLDPQGLASRAEVAAVLMSYFRNVMY